MSRFRFTGLIVYFAAVAALAPVVLTGCDHAAREFASDARADTLPAATPPPTQATGDRQFSAMPSLAPIVKQLRPTVVNVASRFKPRRVARNSQRPPQGQGRGQQRPNPFENAPGDDDESGQGQGQGQEDPMERFFRFFGGGPQGQGQAPDQQERHGLGSGFLIGDGYVLTNNHVVEVQDPGSNKFRPMDDIKVSTDETAPGGSREFIAKVVGNDPKSDVALLKIEGEHVAELPRATLGDSDALQVGDYVIAIGEPYTEARRNAVTGAGATAVPSYAFNEAGAVGFGCREPRVSDDIHVLSNTYGLVQRRRPIGDSGLTVDAFLFTSLLRTGPKVLLNAENGDHGTVTRRGCECLYGALGLDMHMWDELAMQLAADRPVLRYDHRGHGGSAVPPGPYTMDDLVDDAARLIREWGRGPIVWIGLSMGGMVGQGLAVRHPELVQAIVLANTSAKYPEAAAAVFAQRVNDVGVSDEKMLLTSANLTPEGVIKLSLGKKRHVLLKPA